MNQIPAGNEPARPFLPAMGFDFSSRFHESPGLEKQVLVLIFLGISCLLSGCVLPKRIGGYPVSGTVVDRCTRVPVDGVTVFLRYSGVSFYSGSVAVEGEPVFTNELGQFNIPPRRLTVMAGIGGFSGEIREWPMVVFSKLDVGRGVFSAYYGRDKDSISSRLYQAMTLEIGEPCDSPYRKTEP